MQKIEFSNHLFATYTVGRGYQVVRDLIGDSQGAVADVTTVLHG